MSRSDIKGYAAERAGGRLSARYVLVRLAGRIAAQLEDLRQEQGLSQRELAKRAGTSKAQVNRLLSGDYTGMTTTSICKVAAALGCDVDVNVHRVKVPYRGAASPSLTPVRARSARRRRTPCA